MTVEALPKRFPDMGFFYADKLDVLFNFSTMSADGESTVALDASLITFAAVARSSLDPDIVQPQLDTSEAGIGRIWVRWTKEQVATLPQNFSLEVSEYALVDTTDDPDSPGQTWAEFPEITWRQMPEFTWAEFPDHVHPAAIWDRTILVGRFVRNLYGES